MKKWYKCPHCGKKLIKYEEKANCEGLFLLCKSCGKEVEIEIHRTEKSL